MLKTRITTNSKCRKAKSIFLMYTTQNVKKLKVKYIFKIICKYKFCFFLVHVACFFIIMHMLYILRYMYYVYNLRLENALLL